MACSASERTLGGRFSPSPSPASPFSAFSASRSALVFALDSSNRDRSSVILSHTVCTFSYSALFFLPSSLSRSLYFWRSSFSFSSSGMPLIIALSLLISSDIFFSSALVFFVLLNSSSFCLIKSVSSFLRIGLAPPLFFSAFLSASSIALTLLV